MQDISIAQINPKRRVFPGWSFAPFLLRRYRHARRASSLGALRCGIPATDYFESLLIAPASLILKAELKNSYTASKKTEKGENAYLTTVENWIDNGIVDKFQDLEYQNFLPLKYWKKIE